MTNTSFDLLDLLNDLPVTSGEITRDETSISWRKVKLNLAVNRSAAPSPESVHGDLPDFEDFEDTVAALQTVDRTEYDDYDGDEGQEIEVADTPGGDEAFDYHSPVSEPLLPDTAAAPHAQTADSSLESAIHALSSMHVSKSTALSSVEKSSRFEVEDASHGPFGDEPSQSLQDLTVPPTPRPQHIRLPRPVAPTSTASSALGLDFSSPIDLTQGEQDASDQFTPLVHNDEQDRSSRSQEAENIIITTIREARDASNPETRNASTQETHDASTPKPDQPIRTVRREGRYDTVYGLKIDDEGYFEVRRPGIPRWSTSKSPQSRRKHRELSLHPRIQSLINVVPRDHRNYSNAWLKKNDRVNRVIEARERRHLRHPEVPVEPPARDNFVKKAIERFGPTWRPQLPRFFNKLLKHASDVVEDPLVFSNPQLPATSSVLTVDSEMDTMVNTSPLPAPTSGNVGSDWAMRPPTTPQAPTLPYLASQIAPSDQSHYAYIVTPPIEPVGLPQLTPGPSSSGVPTPCIPTPSSGQITLPTLPPFVHSPGPIPSSSPVLSSPRDFGKPVVYGADASQQVPTVRAPVPVRPASVGLPYLVSDAQRVNDDVPYIVTPPLPSSSLPAVTQPTSRPTAVCLPYLVSDTQRTIGSSDVPYIVTPPLPSSSLPSITLSVPSASHSAFLPSFVVNSTTVNQGVPYVPTPSPQPLFQPTLPASQLLTVSNPALEASPFVVPQVTNATQQVQQTNFSPLPQTAPVATQRPQPPQLKLPTLPPLVIHPQPTSLQRPLQRSQPPQLKVPTIPPIAHPSLPPPVPQAFPQYASTNIVPQQFTIPTQRPVLPPSAVPLPPTAFPYNPDLLLRSGLPVQQVDSMDCAEDDCVGGLPFEGNITHVGPEVDMESPIQQPSVPEFVMGNVVTQVGGGLQMNVGEGICVPTPPLVASCDGATLPQFAVQATLEKTVERETAEGVEGVSNEPKLGVIEEEAVGTHGESVDDDDEDSLSGDPPPFDETDPLWEEILAYNAVSTAEGDSSHMGKETSLEREDKDQGGETELPLAEGDVKYEQADGSFAADDKCDLRGGLPNQDCGNVNVESGHDEVSESLWAWATGPGPEIVDQSPGSVEPPQDVPFVTPNTSVKVEPPSSTDFPTFQQDHSHSESYPKASPSTEFPSPKQEHPSPLPTITVELVDSCPPSEASQPDTHLPEQQPSFSSTFALDELDWEVMEEYARQENIKLPCTSYAAACIMVDAIQTVASLRITALLTNSENGVGGVEMSSLFSQSLEELLAGTTSPSYVYTSLDPSCDFGQAYGCSDFLGARVPPQPHAFVVG